MKIIWNDNTIDWFRDASEYTGYNRILSEILMEHIPHRGTICDMGCGTALIDYELAKHFHQITCVDISQEAIDSIQKRIEEENIANINPLCLDGKTLSGSFDTVIALFHGGSNVFSDYYHLAKDQLIIITHIGSRNTFSPKKHRCDHHYSAERTMAYLKEQNIKYHYIEQSIEYGQPFRSFEDAMLFMDVYSAPGMGTEEKRAHLETQLIKTEKKEFPYYMPKRKNMGIFIINKWENPNIGV
jgi:SAM-dependent methyltransferase